MRFRDWILNEDFNATSSDLTGDLFYPTNAGDYPYVTNKPVEHWWLQWKWDQEKRQGRKFYNIDQEEFDKRGYVSLQSKTMPDKKWTHKPDSRSNVETIKTPDLIQIGVGKDSNDIKKLVSVPTISVTYPLDKIFKDTPSGKWQKLACDKKWKPKSS
jgi:hypothetical protein